MSAAGSEASPRRTTQKALLEPLLAKLRSAKAKPWVAGHVVLDFGCGADCWNLRSLDGLAARRIGFDLLFSGQSPKTCADGILVIGSLADAVGLGIDRVTSLACFEHIDPDELPAILSEIAAITTPDAVIFGTVPTPLAKPVLEFLSYKLGIVDESQIRDHKIYYDRERLTAVVARGGWKLSRYRRFQLGMNSWFTLTKV